MKKGISLIVLVITIIVMIILAASVVITLSNTGIIDRASQAVDLSNERQVQDLASMIWAEVYLDESRTDSIEKVVKDKLADQGITDENWDIVVSGTGVSVTTKKESEWPITWNMAEITNNISIDIGGGMLYKVSDVMPTEGQMAGAVISMSSVSIICAPYFNEENINVYAALDETSTYQLILFVVKKAGAVCQQFGGIVFEESGIYVADAGGNLEGQDVNLSLNIQSGIYEETITDSWSEIKTYVDNGTYKSHYKLGDTKGIKCLDGRTILVEIVAFDADAKADGTKASITWMTKNIVNTGSMNSTDTVVGGWKDSEMRNWLQNDFYAILPSEVTSSIVLVDKTYYDFDTRSTLSCLDSLWLPSRHEVFSEETDTGAYREASGVDYSSYFTSNKIRMKKYNGLPLPWWLRSSTGFSNSGKGFSFVEESGKMCGSTSATRANDVLGIVFGFCM